MPKILEFPRIVQQPYERRRFARHRMDLRCLVKLGSFTAAKQALFLAEMVNASKSGYFIVARESAVWEVGAEIECVVKAPASGERQLAMRFNGKVVRIANQGDGRIGVGVMLDDLVLPVPSPQLKFKRHIFRQPEAQRLEMSMAA